jgi:hypothetical protein
MLFAREGKSEQCKASRRNMICMGNEATHLFIPSRLGGFSANARTCITFVEFCGKEDLTVDQ